MIGETGLDFFKADNPDQQIVALNSQLEIAAELIFPVMFIVETQLFKVLIVSDSLRIESDRCAGV
jgi:TatD DNase family protein